MSKQLVGADHFLAELNRELRLDADYSAGMPDFPVVEAGTTGRFMDGYSLGDDPSTQVIYRRVAQRVHAKFDCTGR